MTDIMSNRLKARLQAAGMTIMPATKVTSNVTRQAAISANGVELAYYTGYAWNWPAFRVHGKPYTMAADAIQAALGWGELS